MSKSSFKMTCLHHSSFTLIVYIYSGEWEQINTLCLEEFALVSHMNLALVNWSNKIRILHMLILIFL